MKHQIKKTDNNGKVEFPSDLKGLTYDEAVVQLNLLSQDNEAVDIDKDFEDSLTLTYADGSFATFEIEEE